MASAESIPGRNVGKTLFERAGDVVTGRNLAARTIARRLASTPDDGNNGSQSPRRRAVEVAAIAAGSTLLTAGLVAAILYTASDGGPIPGQDGVPIPEPIPHPTR